MAILPAPLGSQAKPIRGAGLNRWPFKQPALEDGPTVAVAKPGTAKVPPLPPHSIMPFSGLPVPGSRAPALPGTTPALSITGEAPATKAVGSKLNASWYFSRYVPNRLTRNPRLRVNFLFTRQSSWKYGSTIFERL